MLVESVDGVLTITLFCRQRYADCRETMRGDRLDDDLFLSGRM